MNAPPESPAVDGREETSSDARLASFPTHSPSGRSDATNRRRKGTEKSSGTKKKSKTKKTPQTESLEGEQIPRKSSRHKKGKRKQERRKKVQVSSSTLPQHAVMQEEHGSADPFDDAGYENIDPIQMDEIVFSNQHSYDSDNPPFVKATPVLQDSAHEENQEPQVSSQTPSDFPPVLEVEDLGMVELQTQHDRSWVTHVNYSNAESRRLAEDWGWNPGKIRRCMIFLISVAFLIVLLISLGLPESGNAEDRNPYQVGTLVGRIRPRLNSSLCLEWTKNNRGLQVVDCGQAETSWDYLSLLGYGVFEIENDCISGFFLAGDCLNFEKNSGFSKKCCSEKISFQCGGRGVRWRFENDTYIRWTGDQWQYNFNTSSYFHKEPDEENPLCMAYDPATLSVSMKACDRNSDFQKWEEYISRSKREC